jgi:hypothetical protein
MATIDEICKVLDCSPAQVSDKPVGAVPVSACAADLGLTVRQLRHALLQGAPVVRHGHKGRGGAALLDPVAISHWMEARGDYSADIARRRQARETIRTLAESLVATFRATQGPHKLIVGRANVLTFQYTASSVLAALGLPPLERSEWPACIDQIDKSTSI